MVVVPGALRGDAKPSRAERCGIHNIVTACHQPVERMPIRR
jgi:hypothetical protein